ncbi:MAG: LytR/AlgR family response regulator transcription factor [Runella zeae]
MKALLIEDEYPAAERLTKLIQKIDANIYIVDVIQSIEAAKSWFATHPAPDLIFSDIQLSDGLCFSIFEEISVKSPIIFTTSYDEYAIKAFKVKSIDYLLKPIKQTELAAAIDKYREWSGNPTPDDYQIRMMSLLDSFPRQEKKFKTRFLVKQNDQLLPIHQQEIAYFFTTNEMVCLVRNDSRTFWIDYTLEELEKLLDTQHFFRLNRQFIAALPSIKKIHTYFNGKLKLELLPATTQEVIISRDKAPTFKDWIEG